MNIQLSESNHPPRLIAENYTPDQPPPRPILQTWCTQAKKTMTVSELDAKLRTGQPFAFGEGRIEWVKEGRKSNGKR